MLPVRARIGRSGHTDLLATELDSRNDSKADERAKTTSCAALNDGSDCVGASSAICLLAFPAAIRRSTLISPGVRALGEVGPLSTPAFGRHGVLGHASRSGTPADRAAPVFQGGGTGCLAHITCRRVRSIDECAGLARVTPWSESLTIRSKTSTRTGCCAPLANPLPRQTSCWLHCDWAR